jgi:hypothetical protein
MDKPGIAVLVKTMLKNKKGSPDSAEEKSDAGKEQDPSAGIAADIISAVKGDDPEALVEALEALKEHWADCGCSD